MGHRLTTDAFLWWGKEVEKRTNGQVKFRWYPGGTLIKGRDSADGLMKGMVDFCIVGLAAKHYFPVTNLILLPFVVDSPIHASEVLWQMYQTMPEMRKEYDKAKFKTFGFFGSGMQEFIWRSGLKVLPKKLEDLKGLKIGCQFPAMKSLVDTLGGTAQMIKTADMYMALQRGMIDGTVWPLAPARSWKIIEVCNQYTMTNAFCAPQGFFMRRDFWEKLPPDVQKIFEDLTPSAGFLAAATLQNETIWVENELKARGDKFYYLSREEKKIWMEKSKPIYDAYIKELNEKGFDGKALFEKMLAISDKLRKNPMSPSKGWWGRAGKKTGNGFVPVESAIK